MKIGKPANNSLISFHFEFGPDGPLSSTPTLKRDGSQGGESLEKYIFDGAAKALNKSMEEFHLINAGAECTRYIVCQVNLVPTTPFLVPTNGEVVIIPKISFDLGIKITQSRITVDRAKKYRFALALENYITGSISTASRPLNAEHTTLAGIVPAEPTPEGEAPVVNGSILRVGIKSFFPFEEMNGLAPIPIESVRRPLV